MSNARLLVLFQLHLHKQLNAAERHELLEILADPVQETDVKELFEEFWTEFEPERRIFSELQSKRILDTILAAEKVKQHHTIMKKWKRALSVAAALLLASGLSLLFISNPASFKSLPPLSVNQGKALSVRKIAAEEKNKVLLTLSDGREIVLNDLSAGEVLNQSGIRITKADDSSLVYSVVQKNNAGDSPVEFNTISTPKGSQYQINLPDGSKVWLNALSSLKFPTQFRGSERVVEIIGEGYFEISEFYSGNIKLPFKVKSVTSKGRNQEVEVLGTHFNINAYPDMPFTKTTLVEGSVKVTNLNSQEVSKLSPGQQAILGGSNTIITRANLEDVLAWKNGNFFFNNLELSEILKVLERWYNIKVDYANIPDTHFQGFISKKAGLRQVLEMLELTGPVKFKISTIPGKSEQKIQLIQE